MADPTIDTVRFPWTGLLLGWLLVAALTAGGHYWLRRRQPVPALLPIAQSLSLPPNHLGLDVPPLATALPGEPVILAGVRDFPGAWQALEKTGFFQAASRQAPEAGFQPEDLSRWAGHVGSNVVAGIYIADVSVPKPEWVVLAEAASDLSPERLKKQVQVPLPYLDKTEGVWILASGPELLAQAKVRVAAPPALTVWVREALARVPSASRVYWIVRPDRMSPLEADRATAWTRAQMWKWLSGGAFIDQGLRLETFGALTANAPGAFREAPRVPHVPLSAVPSPALFLAVQADMRALWEEFQERLPDPQKQLWDMAKKSLEEKKGWSPERFARYLGDEAGVYVGAWGKEKSFPPAAAYIRVRHAWAFSLLLGRALKKAGWARHKGVWLRAGGTGPLSVSLAATVRKGTLFVGTRPGVDILSGAAGGAGGPAFGLDAPARVSSLSLVDLGGLAGGVARTLGALGGPAGPGGPRGRFAEAGSLAPIFASYSVNTREGVYFRSRLHWRERTAEEWETIFEKLRKSPASDGAAGGAAVPPA